MACSHSRGDCKCYSHIFTKQGTRTRRHAFPTPAKGPSGRLLAFQHTLPCTHSTRLPPTLLASGNWSNPQKQNKPDYTAPKAYRIISLLNCLGKISENIIATRLSYLAETADLLHNEQMRGRRYREAIDAVLCLLHDITKANNNKHILSILFFDVKGTYDHVSKA